MKPLLFKIKKLIVLLIILSIAFGLYSNGNNEFLSIAQNGAPTSTANKELEALKKKMQELEYQLNNIKSEKDQVEVQIENERYNSEIYSQDANRLANVIYQNELQLQSLEIELEKLQVEIDINKEETSEIKVRLEEIANEIERVKEEEKITANYFHKMTFNSPSFLDDQSVLEDITVSTKRQESVLLILNKYRSEVESLEAETAGKQQELLTKQSELEDLLAQIETQKTNITVQQQALAWQKEAKLTLATASKKNQDELTEKQKNLDTQISQMEQQILNLRASLYNAPPSGSRIEAGVIIGFQGRSGWVCEYVSDEEIGNYPPEDYTSKYCGGNPFYFFYDVNKYPTAGSHLHFEYSKDGAGQYPYNYIFDEAYKSEFDYPPMNPVWMTRGWHPNSAIDLSGGHGAPIYAIKSGTIRYVCDRFPENPAYGAIIYHDDGSASQYWHMQRRADSPPCEQL